MTPEKLGPYRLVRRLGRGGMGTVYEGIHIESEEKAAVKSLAADLGSEADFRKRFGLEIETLRRLNHPHIVRLFGFGEQDGQLFYSMELVHGVSIEAEIRQGRRFSWKETIHIGKQICLALRHAHDRGIIHRDLKPANLILEENNSIKLADFGIARLFGDARITTAGGVIGTVEYMAPEQAAARPIDHRADLYSLGGVLFALLAGRPPLVSRSLPEMLEKLKNDQPERVDRISLQVPVELAILIEQLLEKDPKRRIPNAMLVERRLEAIEHGLEHKQAQQESIGSKVDGLDGDFDIDEPTDSKKRQRKTPEPTPTNLAVTQPLDGGDKTPPVVLERTRAIEPNNPEPKKTPPENLTYAHDPMAQAKTVTNALPEQKSPEQKSKSSSAVTRTMSEQEKSDSKKRTGRIRTEHDGNNHFTEVAEEELDRAFAEENRSALVSIQTWILTGCLVAVGAIIWLFLQPPTADSLYDKIENAAKEGKMDSLRDVQDEIEDFLSRYSSDHRAKTVRVYREELDLYLLERRLETQMSKLSNRKKVDPVERAYLEAKHYLEIEPEVGMKKLQALIDLYSSDAPGRSTADDFVRVARRQLKKIESQMKKAAEAHKNLLDAKLEQAASLQETDPVRAQAMYRAIITLYGDKPWAKAYVDRARQAIGEN